MQFTRREFLITTGLACATHARAAGLPRIVYTGVEDQGPLERSLPTLCRQCPGGCGLRVRIVDDRVVGVAGNADHPINRGGLCARAPAALETLYNPDRVTQPLVLSGPKGSGRYEPISWDDAVERLASRLTTIRRSPGPHTLAVVAGDERGLRRELWSRFLQAFGSNNLIDGSPTGSRGGLPHIRAMQGFDQAVGYDVARARYLLSFGSQWLDDHWSPVQASRAFAALRSQRESVGARVVHVEPRLSITAAKAHEWVPIRPGTDGALALGLAHVIVREGLYDREFVERFTHGFSDPPAHGEERLGFRRLVLRDYPPAKVARLTGTDEGTIFRVAREFATARPAVAVGFDGQGVSTQRSYDRMAIHALNALVGSIDVPGGVTHFQDLTLLEAPVPEPDEAARRGLARPTIDGAAPELHPLGERSPDQLAERLLAGIPYPIDTLILAGGNPVFTSARPERMEQALERVPLLVSLSPWIDESSRWADLIIPDQHFLARWDLDVAHTLEGSPTVTVGQPVVKPPRSSEGGDAIELILALARHVGEPLTEALPFASAEEAVRRGAERLLALGRGGPFGTRDEEGWTKLLERGGWRIPEGESRDAFRYRVLAAGGWTDPIYHHREWSRVFRAPRRRFAFHSAVLEDRLRPTTAEADIRCLPHAEKPADENLEEAFPLRLYVFPLPLLAGLADANVPWLIEASGAYVSRHWREWLEIHPETAAEHGIADGDDVVVTSPRGRLEVPAKIFAGIMPGVVAIPWGLGHEAGGRWCAGVGQSPSELVDTSVDSLTAARFWNDTRVAIEKA